MIMGKGDWFIICCLSLLAVRDFFFSIACSDNDKAVKLVKISFIISTLISIRYLWKYIL